MTALHKTAAGTSWVKRSAHGLDVDPGADWRDRAACLSVHPEVMFPHERDAAGVDRAKAVCNPCPVKAECLAASRRLEATHGIWGGLTPDERRRHGAAIGRDPEAEMQWSLVTGWTLRAVWPIHDPELAHSEAIRLAAEDLPQVARRSQSLIVGEPTWRVVDVAEWPDVDAAVVCVVEAVPDHSRWPQVVRDMAGEGMTDRQIAGLLRCQPERVRGVRRRFGIAPGVRPGSRPRELVAVAE